MFDFKEVYLMLYIEIVLFLCIWTLSVKCWERQSHIDEVWNQYWNRMEGIKSSVIRLNKEFIEEFGSDDAVNRALESMRAQSSESSTKN
jgi:hypothetical protein